MIYLSAFIVYETFISIMIIKHELKYMGEGNNIKLCQNTHTLYEHWNGF